MHSSNLIEIQPERDVSGDNFSKGQINFNWTMASNAYFNPRLSFIKLRYRLYKVVDDEDVSIEKSDNIAMNMFLVDNLIQSQKMLLNNMCLSEHGDYVPQIKALKTRMDDSEEHINNYLSYTNYAQAYLTERQCALVPDTNVVTSDSFNAPAGINFAYTSDTGAIAFSGAGAPDVQIGDIIVLPTGAEYPIITRTSATVMGSFQNGANVVATPDWLYRRQNNNGGDNLYNNFRECRDTQTFEAIWRPGLGFFDLDQFIPGCGGLWNLRLTPQPDQVYQRCAIENGTGVNINTGNPADSDRPYVFEIISMNLYLLKGLSSPYKGKMCSLEYMETRCQSQNITTNSLHQKTFQVHPKTTELTLAYQLSGASIDNNAFSAAKFQSNGSDELKIRRFWINYAGRQLPTPIPDTEYNNVSKIDYLTQRWVESLIYADLQYSPEPLDKWLLGRGPYYHFSGYPEADDNKSDRVFVSQQFDAFADNNIRPNVLLFDHWAKKIDIYISDGRVSDVKVY